jgi:hypothetical protein
MATNPTSVLPASADAPETGPGGPATSAGTDLSLDDAVRAAQRQEHFGNDRSVGNRGITSAVRIATAQAGRPFAAPVLIAPRGRHYRTTPFVAAAGGRVALEWGFEASRNDFGVQAAVGRARAPGPPQTIVRTPTSLFFGSAPFGRVTLDADGAATVLYGDAVQMPAGPVFRLLAADGP